MRVLKDIHFYLSITDHSRYERVKSIAKSFTRCRGVSALPSEEELNSKLSSDLDFFIYIVDASSDKYSSYTKDIEKLTKNGVSILLFVDEEELRTHQESPYRDCFLSNKFSMTSLSSCLSKIIAEHESDYVAISINNFYKSAIFPCNVFVKLGPKKFVKVAHPGAKVEVEIIEKYKSRNVEEFYVQRSDFYKNCEELFSTKLVADTVFETKEEALIKNHEILHDMVKTLGVNQFIVSAVDESVKSIEESLKKPELAKVLSLFEEMKGTFIYDHSYLTMIFCAIICRHMDWEGPQITEKLAQAAMFHDLALADNKLALLENSPWESIKSKGKLIADDLFRHGTKIAEMLEVDQSISQEVINICKNHNEGLGKEFSFPRGLTGTNLTQLECVFILAHEFSMELFKNVFNPMKIDKICDTLEIKYSSGNFKPVIAAFKKAIEEEIKPQL